MTIAEVRLLLQQLELQVTVIRERIDASIGSQALLAQANIEHETDFRIELVVPTTTASFGHEQPLRLESSGQGTLPRDARLVDLVTRGFASRDELMMLNPEEHAAMPVTQHRNLERTTRLANAPRHRWRIIDGRQPKTLTARELARLGSLSLRWTEERTMLGFEPA